MKKNTIVHLKHFQDGYPLCWPMTKSGYFEGTYEDKDVTCEKCLQFMHEIR